MQPLGATTVVVTTGAGNLGSLQCHHQCGGALVASPARPARRSGIFANLKGTFISNTNLANPGDELMLYATGLGATNPVVPAGPAPRNCSEYRYVADAYGWRSRRHGIFCRLIAGASGTVPDQFYGSGNRSGQRAGGVEHWRPEQQQRDFDVVRHFGDHQRRLLPSTPARRPPEEMISLFANGLGSTNQLSGVFPGTTAQGVSVTINGISAPIFALAATGSQINLIVPSETPTTGTVQVQLTTPTGTSLDFPLIMSAAVPGMFLITDPSNPVGANCHRAVCQYGLAGGAYISTAKALQIPQNCTASNGEPAFLLRTAGCTRRLPGPLYDGSGRSDAQWRSQRHSAGYGRDCAGERQPAVRDHGRAHRPELAA